MLQVGMMRMIGMIGCGDDGCDGCVDYAKSMNGNDWTRCGRSNGGSSGEGDAGGSGCEG